MKEANGLRVERCDGQDGVTHVPKYRILGVGDGSRLSGGREKGGEI